MGKHKGRRKQASHRHKLSKSSRFEASFNGTGDLEGFEKDITRGKLYCTVYKRFFVFSTSTKALCCWSDLP